MPEGLHSAAGAMNSARTQIQDAAKRLKRVGESSQQMGEITALAADLAEQAQVLALNAAIQAASAQACGQDFSTVAGEAQRLAARSADAAALIGALVQALQADTHDAVAALERATQGVVAGARLLEGSAAPSPIPSPTEPRFGS
jgi:twitching motility protein PilJ